MSLALVVGQEIADRYLRAHKTVKKIFSNISFANLGGGKLARPIERISLCHASFDIETAHRRQVKLEISLEFRKQSAIELNWRDKIGSGKVAATIAATEREREKEKRRGRIAGRVEIHVVVIFPRIRTDPPPSSCLM